MPSILRSARARSASAPNIRTSTCAWSATKKARAICINPASPTRARSGKREEASMTYTNFKLAIDGDGIALLTWNVPDRSMNVITLQGIEELSAIVEQLAADAAVKGVVVTSAKDTFCGGADVSLLESLGRTYAAIAAELGEEQAALRFFEESRR